MNIRLNKIKDIRIGWRYGAAVDNRPELTLGSGLFSEFLVGEVGVRCAGVTVIVDVTLNGVENARVYRRHGVTMSNGSWDGSVISVMNFGWAIVVFFEPVVLGLFGLCSDELVSEGDAFMRESSSFFVVVLKGILFLKQESRYNDRVKCLLKN